MGHCQHLQDKEGPISIVQRLNFGEWLEVRLAITSSLSKIYVCETLMPPPQHIKNRLDLDLNIDRGYLLIKDYLPAKFKASYAKHSWVISCTRCGRPAWPLTLAFNLLTRIFIRNHLLIMDYLPTKFEASLAKRSWVISCIRCGRPTWPLTFTLITIRIILSSRTIYLPSLKLLWQNLLDLSVAKIKGDRHNDMCKAICPFFFEGRINI